MSKFYPTYDAESNYAYKNLVHAAKVRDLRSNKTKHIGSKPKRSLLNRSKPKKSLLNRSK